MWFGLTRQLAGADLNSTAPDWSLPSQLVRFAWRHQLAMLGYVVDLQTRFELFPHCVGRQKADWRLLASRVWQMVRRNLRYVYGQEGNSTRRQ